MHDYFEHDGTPYIAMEYVERGSLRPYVGRMNLAQIGGVLEGLLAGLTHAESHGIVHRDLKPENLMVTADGRVKIADFGIAKATTKMQTGAFLTATGTTVGTPTYMAPEQAMAQDIGPWTDLYSVGCMAFEMFTGNVPFHDSDAPMAILLRHVNEPIAPVKSHPARRSTSGISDWIERAAGQGADAAHAERQRRVGRLRGDPARPARPALAPRGAAGRARDEQGANGAKPLTPAPFPGTTAGDAASEEFKSFAWGAPASDTGPSASPPMYTPPPSASTPSIPDAVVGPPTPMPSQARPGARRAPDPSRSPRRASSPSARPAPPPPTDALIARRPRRPTRAAPVVETPATEPRPTPPRRGRADRLRRRPRPRQRRCARRGVLRTAADLTPPPEDVAPPKAFETYIAPPPSRPPTSEPKLTPPPVEAARRSPRARRTAGPRRRRSVAPLVADTMMPQTLSGAAVEGARRAEGALRRDGGRPVDRPAAIAGGVATSASSAALVAGGGGERPRGRRGHRDHAGPPRPAAAVPIAASGSRCKVPAGWSRGPATRPPCPAWPTAP